MFKNYLKIAWRNLVRNKTYSTINIVGLAFGMAVALLIGLWVTDELNVNKNFTHYDRLVSVMENSTYKGDIQTFSQVPLALAVEMRTKYASDFKTVGMMTGTGGHIIAYGDTKIGKEGSRYAEPQMMDILSLHMIRGGSGALNGPASMIIDQTMATALFGKTDPLNKLVKVDNKQFSRVTGVFEDFPHSSAFATTHYLESWAEFVAENPEVKELGDKWNANAFETYAVLQDQAGLDKVSAKVKNLLQGHGREDHPEVLLQPMSRWHLYGDFKNGKNAGGGIEFVKLFGLIGLFVLLLACINFMNLSTARSERRAREVGIRKAVGSLRVQLVVQFLGESLLISFLALTLAVVLAWLSLSWFSRVADKRMSIPWGSPVFWSMLAAFTVFTGLIAGSYPAFYLSSFNSVKVLKGSFKAGRMASLPRKILVVLQFTVSVALIIGTLVVSRQIQYARDRPMGFDRANSLTIYRSTPELMHNYNVIRQELLGNGGIWDMALANGPVTTLINTQSGFEWPGKDPGVDPNFGVLGVSQNFGPTVKWEITQGRDFSGEFLSDSAGLVLDESAVKLMGLQKPIGTPIKLGHQNFHVIGVVRDLVIGSPFQSAMPTIFGMEADSNLTWITLKLNPSISTAKALALVGPVFRTYNPGSPFDYWINDEKYADNFVLEQRIGVLTRIFAAFAIFISCLGLFGLASFMAEQRTREIGVRKILGASVLHLWGLLSKEFLLLVMLSFFIALPVSYFYMHSWLQRYSYRTSIPAWILLGTMGMALAITLVTVSAQSIRASMANPVRSLRTE